MKTLVKIVVVLFLGGLMTYMNGCKKDNGPGPASIKTSPVTNIAFDSATSGGEIISDGGTAITVSGICWSTNANPTTADSKTTDGTQSGTFISNMAGLSSSTVYHVRAFFTNGQETVYGNDIMFVTPIDK